jgi:hypothetical protein
MVVDDATAATGERSSWWLDQRSFGGVRDPPLAA